MSPPTTRGGGPLYISKTSKAKDFRFHIEENIDAIMPTNIAFAKCTTELLLNGCSVIIAASVSFRDVKNLRNVPAVLKSHGASYQEVADVRAATADAEPPTFTPVPTRCVFDSLALVTPDNVADLIRSLPDQTNNVSSIRFLPGV